MFQRTIVPGQIRPEKKPVREFTTEELTPPNHRYLVITRSRTDATYRTAPGINETLVMEASPNGMNFSVTKKTTEVLLNNKEKKSYYPMDQWDDLYASLIKKGGILYSEQPIEKKTVEVAGLQNPNGQSYIPLRDEYVAEIVRRLTTYANQMVEETYQKSISAVPEKNFDMARKVLDDLARRNDSISNTEFNEHLDILFAILPRRIDVRSKYIAKDDASADDRGEIIETERERLETLHTVIYGGRLEHGIRDATILDAYGIEIRRFTREEESFAKRHLTGQKDKYVNGWRVINHRTEAAFEEFCKREGLTEEKGIDFLFHGSRTENWWSIITKGLTINPVGVVITGKAYGLGTYFAPDAIKSAGYTSRTGAKYTSGGQNTGFMAIYRVATGNRYNGNRGVDHTLTWDKLQQIQPGAHCTWAECRWSGFMMDEVIVYKDEQSTIWGLLELAQ